MANPDINNSPVLQEDKKMEEEINRKLSAIITWDTTDVQVKVQESSVLITGTVADTKSLEQTVLVIFTVKGVRQIDNKLRIRKDGAPSVMNRAAVDIESIPHEDEKNKLQ